MRVVLDTNVLASGFRTGGTTPPPLLVDAWIEQQFGLVVSEHILDELRRVFQTPYFVRQLTAPQIDRALQLLEDAAVLTEVGVPVHGVARRIPRTTRCWPRPCPQRRISW